MFNIKGTNKLEDYIIISIIALLSIFSIIIEIVGYNRFTVTYTKEYNDSAYKIGLTAAAIINKDNIPSYLQGNSDSEEYKTTYKRLNILTNKMGTSVIYAIKPTDDYKHYYSIFNSVNKNSGYTPWEVGSIHDTSNKKYEKYYKQLMNGEIDRAVVVVREKRKGYNDHVTSLLPLKDSNGKVAGILCVQRFMKNLSRARQKYILEVSSLTLIIMIISIILVKIFIRKQIVQPIIKINDEAKRFANDDNKMKKEIKEISKISEVASLAISINKMENDTVKYIDNITSITKEKERIGTELKLAKSIQENSLPTTFPAFPEKHEFDLYATMTPAKEVGGDFYDFFLIDDNHLGVVIADVSGKGVPAALFMMVTKILINEYSLSINNPGEVLTTVNDRICNSNKDNMFITVLLGILDTSTGKMTISIAGHEDACIYRNGEEFTIDKRKHDIPLGVMEGYKYNNYDIKLNSGDKIFIYTDGVNESENKEREMFGLDRMIKSLNSVSSKDPKTILEKVKEDVDLFADGADQFDDITMLCLEYKQKVNNMKNRFKTDTSELEEVTAFVHKSLGDKVNKKIIMKLDVCIEEIFVNICNYAYKKTGYVDIEISLDDSKFAITFIDEGIPFNPLEKDEPNINLSSEDREIGGLGIFMVKKMMDKVSYKHDNNKNILTIEKNLGGK